MAQTSTTKNLPEETKKNLFNDVMHQKWEEAAKIYKQYPSARTLKITSSGETALHLVISDPEHKKNKLKNVETLVGSDKDQIKELINLQTEKGNTPLHSAAATGQSGKACQFLIESVRDVEKQNVLELVRVRCKKGETPLSKAVQYGRPGSFFYLNSVIKKHYGEKFSHFERNDDQSILEDPIISSILVRKDDGQSILHEAIIREQFGLAFYIIELYRGLVNLVDNQGESPLHALARKPAAFKSGSSLHGWDKLIYKCIPVEKLKPLEWDKESREGSNIPRKITKPLRRSRQTCRIWYCFVIFGYGRKAVDKIYKEKLKHTWAKQVLDELLKHATMYDKKNTTAQPQDEDSEDVSESSRVVSSSSSGTNAGGKDVSQSSREEPSSSSGTGKDESSKIEKKDTVPYIAAKYGIIDMVKRIIDKFEVVIHDENINGNNVKLVAVEKDESSKQKDTALLIAAKYGIVKMVKRIIDKFPVVIHDEDINGNNVLLVAVKKRHLQLYKYLIKKYPEKSVVHQREDKKGNTALHLAATYDKEQLWPWPVPGAALQMQWEIKWYEFVEYTMPSCLFLRTNKEDKTPRDIFSTTHKDLINDGMQWLQVTARSCSVVAALIVTIAFASSTNVPGGTDRTGKPILRNNSTFNIFAIASLIALCFSVTALVTFLIILTSRYHERDFGKDLPCKILMGLTSLFWSTAAMLVTFCASRFLVFEEKIEYAAFPIYAVTFFPLCLLAVAQFPLYFDLVRAICFSPFRSDFSTFLKKQKKKVKGVLKPREARAYW